MDVEAAFSRLPETHAAALRLRARSFDDDAIGAALALEPEAVAPLLRIAEAKLEGLTGRSCEARTDVRPDIEARGKVARSEPRCRGRGGGRRAGEMGR